MKLPLVSERADLVLVIAFLWANIYNNLKRPKSCALLN